MPQHPVFSQDLEAAGQVLALGPDALVVSPSGEYSLHPNPGACSSRLATTAGITQEDVTIDVGDYTFTINGLLLLVGPTGAGKTTLLQRALKTNLPIRHVKFFEPADGTEATQVTTYHDLLRLIMKMSTTKEPGLLTVDSFRYFLYRNDPFGNTGEGGMSMNFYIQMTDLDRALRQTGMTMIAAVNPMLDLADEKARIKYSAIVDRLSASASTLAFPADGSGQLTYNGRGATFGRRSDVMPFDPRNYYGIDMPIGPERVPFLEPHTTAVAEAARAPSLLREVTMIQQSRRPR